MIAASASDLFEQSLRALKELVDYGPGVRVERDQEGRYEVRAVFGSGRQVGGKGRKLLAAILDCRELAATQGRACTSCGQIALDGSLCLEHRGP